MNINGEIWAGWKTLCKPIRTQGKCSRPEQERPINSCTRRARQDTAACVYADPRRFLIGSLLRAFLFRCAWSQGSSAATHEWGRQMPPDNPALHGTKIELEQSLH